MTKRWSSTRSMDGNTKQSASKERRRALARELPKAEKEPPEGEFTSVEEMLAWLNSE